MGKQLRPGFAAGVKTTDTTLVVTVAGPVQMPVEVYVPAGGELPDNLADGEQARLNALGAFTPVLPYAERVRLQGAALKDAFDEDAFVVPQSYPPSLAHGTAAVGEEVTTPGLAVDELPAPLPDDDEVAGPLPEGTSDVHGNVSPDLAHGTPAEGETVEPEKKSTRAKAATKKSE
jgi:hypothetical protein